MRIDEKLIRDNLGNFLIEAVQQIDRNCSKDGVDYGLYNVREQLAGEAFISIGKKLTEETLVSWFIQSQLAKAGIDARCEEPYPDSLEHCDVLIPIDKKTDFALEVKFAWKKWIWWDGSVHTSPAFKGYLLGDATHRGTAHDFGKLERGRWKRATRLGVFLIGFDTFARPMDDKIAMLEHQENLSERGWRLDAHRAWADRKNQAFRIGCWFWCRQAGIDNEVSQNAELGQASRK